MMVSLISVRVNDGIIDIGTDHGVLMMVSLTLVRQTGHLKFKHSRYINILFKF